MSTVTDVSLANTRNPSITAVSGVTSSGISDNPFSFLGVLAGQRVTVVLQARYGMASASLNGSNDGAVVTKDGNNSYLYITVSTGDANNWSVRARSNTDGSGSGMTFTAGTGGGRPKK